MTHCYVYMEKNYFDKLEKHGVKVKYIYCINTRSPSLDDMTQVIEDESYTEPILYGCLGGYGRTGCALACYLCKYGLDGLDGLDGLNEKGLSSEQAITCLRKIRPKSIESNDQMNFIKKYSNSIHNSVSERPSNKIKRSAQYYR